MSDVQVQSLKTEGNILGGVFLITGCCVGAGMVGLPAVTALSGFVPSVLLFFLAWLFMVSTGLLLLEVNLWFQSKVNLLSMSEATLGKLGKFICGGLFLFLFFSLIIAYLSGSGILITDFFSHVFNKQVNESVGIVFCTFLLGIALYNGARSIDIINRVCAIGMILAYFAILLLGLSKINISNLSHINFSSSTFFSIPVILIAFGYQNLIPSLTVYLNRDRKKIQFTILLGCSLPFLIYILWEAIIFGLLSSHSLTQLSTSSSGEFVTRFLKRTLQSDYVALFIQVFSFFAFLTSLLTVALSCMDFLSEAIRVRSKRINRMLLSCAILFFPMIFAIKNPNLFIKGLSMAGGLGAVVLFGVFPVLMVWKCRDKNKQGYQILPGGKGVLCILMTASIIIFTLELINQFYSR